MNPSAPGSPRILLTVEVEDYFHVGRFEQLIQRDQWYRFEGRLERNTRKTLDLLESFRIKATFFVLGWVGDNLPELVREIARRGHEVASMGYGHRTIEQKQLDRGEFREDVVRSREALERACGRRVLGNRVPHYLGPTDLWALDVLADAGYVYDSSLRPILRSLAREPWRRVVHQHGSTERPLWEFPLSSWGLLGWSIPIAGAGYFRHFPHAAMKLAVKRWHPRYRAPFVMYFRVWELDPEQPRIEAVSRLAKLRHYRNLDKMERVLRDYFQDYQVGGIADYLGLDPGSVAAVVPAAPAPQPAPARQAAESGAGLPRPRVSIVVPCYNESATLGYLANTLKSVEAELEAQYDLRFIFVDDASGDDTWDSLSRLFGGNRRCRLIRHDRNRGVAAAILTGIRAADTEIVCSIDCDCTYDPHELRRMIPLLTPGVDLVTASPYHPQGLVRNVPGWRLSLSRGASFLYRRVLRQKLATYTSCFRVYRKSAVEPLHLAEGGFLGVAEMLGKLDLRGGRVVEHPATLEVRIFGQSKMKVLRATLGHLRLLARLLALRLAARGASAEAAPERGSTASP